MIKWRNTNLQMEKSMSLLSNKLESILFVSGKEVEEAFIKEKLEVSDKEYEKAVAELKEKFSGENGINLMRFNKKLQFCSNPAYAKAAKLCLST